jgi:hypothetical protein
MIVSPIFDGSVMPLSTPLRRIAGMLLVAVPAVSMTAESELEGVNRIRAAAGLPVLQPEKRLGHAAELHAAYLDRHREAGATGQGLSAHAQQPGLEGFSGESPGSRALAADYPQRNVLENVSMGYDSTAEALDGLMSAIYHRLTFLDLAADEIGIAVGQRSRVFMLGRSDVRALCDDPPETALVEQPIDCLGEVMTRNAYDAMCGNLPATAHFEAPHPVACPGGQRLNAGFMQRLCSQPPAGARLSGGGRYYEPCANGTRIRKAWFDAFCQAPPARAIYRSTGQYYEICDDRHRVDASWLESRCAALSADERYTDSGRFQRPCAVPHDIRVEYLEMLDRERLAELPKAIIWPPDGATDVPPAFFIEEPDPLPQHEVSGFPLSVQFNPALVGRVESVSFQLTRIDRGRPEPVREALLLDHDSDPNGLLTTHESAFFPLQRLAWGARYEARLEALLDGVPWQQSWSFATAGSDTPVLRLVESGTHFTIRSGQPYLLYLPPTADSAMTALKAWTRHIRANHVDMQPVDPNTLRLRIEARLCDRISVRFDDGRVAILIPEGCPQ